MKQNAFIGSDYVWAIRPGRVRLPLIIDRGLERDIDYWASAISCDCEELIEATASVIRKCHHAAVVESMSIGNHPEVYQLGIATLVVMYTIENDKIVVRGYAPNLPRDQVDEEIAGGYYCDVAWGLPVDITPLDADSTKENKQL